MLAENLLEKIGYTDVMIEEYSKYKNIFGENLEALAKLTVENDVHLTESCLVARKFAPDLNEYTVDLMFILECTGYLLEKYRKNNIPDAMFYDAMIDIRCKTEECMKLKGVFGTFVTAWFNAFFVLKRLVFGRLQYDITDFVDDEVTENEIIIDGFSVKRGDFVLKCHIPSSGPLNYELCLDSYKKAYSYFKDKIKDNVLVVHCASYFLFPDYKEIFKECSPNIYNFIKDYRVFTVNYADEFKAAWRIFNEDVDGHNTVGLPQNTRLQKGFVKYIDNGGRYGNGHGILLFDGKKILT